MTDDLKNYEATIKRKHSFGWTPKFESSFQTQLSKTTFAPIVVETITKLGWEVVYQDECTVEARTKGGWNKTTEGITVSYHYGEVRAKSESLGSEWWDLGRNSKRVGLFKHAFQQIEKQYDKEALIQLEKETEATINWDNYEIPDSLPQPKPYRKPKLWISFLGGILTGLTLGLIIALVTAKGIYILLLFEVVVALLIGMILQLLIKLSNYTDYDRLHYVLIGIVLTTYISNQYFQYQIILYENDYPPIGFLRFIEIKLEAGLIFKDYNTGWIGMLLSWVVQLGVTYLFGTIKLSSSLISYCINRVPAEVTDFAYYNFLSNKSMQEVRSELSRMGWTDEQHQDEVFEAIDAIHGSINFNRL